MMRGGGGGGGGKRARRTRLRWGDIPGLRGRCPTLPRRSERVPLLRAGVALAVKIRLMRVGKKKQPSYRVVVTDSRSPRDGRFIEVIGQYAPRAEPSVVTIDADRALHWLKVGAQPTEQAGKLLEIAGVWAAYKTQVRTDAVVKPKAKWKAKT